MTLQITWPQRSTLFIFRWLNPFDRFKAVDCPRVEAPGQSTKDLYIYNRYKIITIQFFYPSRHMQISENNHNFLNVEQLLFNTISTDFSRIGRILRRGRRGGVTCLQAHQWARNWPLRGQFQWQARPLAWRTTPSPAWGTSLTSSLMPSFAIRNAQNHREGNKGGVLQNVGNELKD